MSSLRGPLGACWGSGRLPPPGKNESPAQYGAFRCFRLVRRTLTVHERGEIGCQRVEQDNQEKADEQGDSVFETSMVCRLGKTRREARCSTCSHGVFKSLTREDFINMACS